MLGRIYSVHCDCVHIRSDKRCHDCTWWIGNTTTAADARRQARRAGWTRPPGLTSRTGRRLDLCPACNAHYTLDAAEAAREPSALQNGDAGRRR